MSSIFLKILFIQLLSSSCYGLSDSHSNSGNYYNSSKHSTPEEFVRLEWEAFERERDDFIKTTIEPGEEEHLRHKRTVMFNNLAPIDLGVLIGFPLTVILPSLSNFFNFNKMGKRSLPDDINDDLDIEIENPIVQPHIDRISAYFELIKIPEKGCQERAICEFSAEPDRYFPISELILTRLRNPSTLPLMGYLDDNDSFGQNQKTNKTLFSLYNNAADHGLSNGLDACHKEYSFKCSDPVETRLNMPVLKFWNFLSSALKFQLKDDIKIHSF